LTTFLAYQLAENRTTFNVRVSAKGFVLCAVIDSIYLGNTCICYLWYSWWWCSVIPFN